jgi:hypothetical protein
MEMKRIIVLVLAGAFFFAGGVRLVATEEEEALREEVEAMRLELAELRELVNQELDDGSSGAVFSMPGAQRIKVSGEIRIREEYNRRLYGPFDPNGNESLDFAHMRTRLRFDMDVMENLAAIIELQDVRVLGSSTTSDDEGVDIKRGEILIDNMFTENLSMEVGRFVMAYGDQRLIGHLEWVDQGRTYDGIRTSYGPEEWYVDFFGVRLDESTVFDQDDTDFIGVYAGQRPEEDALGLEGYAIMVRDQNNDILFPGPVDNTRFWTVGVRAFGTQERLDYSGELAYQTGDLGNNDLEAMAFALTGGFTLEDMESKPRIGLEVDYASGDHRPGDGDMETFQTLFPTNHMHYGYADLVGWSNMWDVRGGVSFMPGEQVTVSFDWHHFMLDDEDGGWINAGGVFIQPGSATASRHLGEEFDATLTWKPMNGLAMLFGCSHFMPGGFVDDTGRDHSADYLYAQARLIF